MDTSKEKRKFAGPSKEEREAKNIVSTTLTCVATIPASWSLVLNEFHEEAKRDIIPCLLSSNINTAKELKQQLPNVKLPYLFLDGMVKKYKTSKAAQGKSKNTKNKVNPTSKVKKIVFGSTVYT